MYRLVIVDDETDVRSRLKKLIAKTGLELEIVGEFDNGIDAYEYIIAEVPDIVITDIKMPYLDGLEMIRQFQQVQKVTKTIIISGFEEFSNAKKAANLDVVGFLSKPITVEELSEVIEKSIKLIDKDVLVAKKLDNLEVFYSENYSITKEYLLLKLALKDELSARLREKCLKDGINLDYKYFSMAMIGKTSMFKNEIDDIQDDGFAIVRKHILDVMPKELAYDIYNFQDKLAILFKGNEKIDTNNLKTLFEGIIAIVENQQTYLFKCGLSAVTGQNIKKIHSQAINVLNSNLFSENEKVVLFSGQIMTEERSVRAGDYEIKQLEYFVKNKSMLECEKYITILESKLVAPTNDIVQSMTILGVIIKSCIDMKELEETVNDVKKIYSKFITLVEDRSRIDYFVNIIKLIKNINSGKVDYNNSSNINLIKRYIEDNFLNKDISLDRLSQDLNISVSYICSLLKKYEKTTFTKIVSHYRIERAKELLENSNLKVFEISSNIGYVDPYYFSYVFKKNMGVSPKDYRINKS